MKLFGGRNGCRQKRSCQSHSEMYLDSMNEIGANTNKIEHLIGLVKQRKDIFKIIGSLDVSEINF